MSSSRASPSIQRLFPPPFHEKTRRSGSFRYGWGWRIIRPAASPSGLVAALLVALRAEPRWSFSPPIQRLFPPSFHEKTRHSGSFRYGWGWRIRTSTDGVRVRSPAVRRIPNWVEPAGLKPATSSDLLFNASSTADACAPCADRPFCAQPRVRPGSGNRTGASSCAGPRRTQKEHGRCRGESHPPDRWCPRP